MALKFRRFGSKHINVGDGNITHVEPADYPSDSRIGFISGEYVTVEGRPLVVVGQLLGRFEPTGPEA